MLVEIIKVLGTPTREEIRWMNPNSQLHRIQVSSDKSMSMAQDLSQENASRSNRSCIPSPSIFIKSAMYCCHPSVVFLLTLSGSEPHARLPNGRPFPSLFNFKQELANAHPELVSRLLPEHAGRHSGS
ncbi:hypothetical protein GUJ93_ZPchr0006g46274 [Zizania palustris]|uniref:Uncharacterized protein n=1 Tax=Zizania palustris TaxID=103762 RepID=A0A8J5SGE6_ZIZPA|nr:hypothetical protein GUJ93_ZPchr0006g46274 [Zizania palustris]